MTDNLQRQGLLLALASIACVGVTIWALGHYDVFSTTEDVSIVVQPSLVRWVVAIVVGLITPQLAAATARWLGAGRLWGRVASFLRNVETMPEKVDEIHAAVCRPQPGSALKENS
jgi:hypothetical protein